MTSETVMVRPPVPKGLEDYKNWTMVYLRDGDTRVEVKTVEEFMEIERQMEAGTSNLTVWHPDWGMDGLWMLTDFHAEKKGWLSYRSYGMSPNAPRDPSYEPGMPLQDRDFFHYAYVCYVWGHPKPAPVPVKRYKRG